MKKKKTSKNIPKSEMPKNDKKLDKEFKLAIPKPPTPVLAFPDELIEQEKNIVILHEEIHPNDTVTTFYNRIQNMVFDKWKENSEYKFYLIIQLKTDACDDQQLKIISEPIPSNYNIPLICSPLVLSVESQTLPPIKASGLVDNGFQQSEIDPRTAIKTISPDLQTLYEVENIYFKRTDDPTCEKEHSLILAELRYKLKKFNDIKSGFMFSLPDLRRNKEMSFIKKNNLTEIGEFSVEFEDLLFYEHVMMNSFIEKQNNNNDKSSAFLFSLLIFQIIRNGDELINDYFSDSFIENFDEYSDIVTVIKTIFPLLKYDQNGSSDGYLNEKEKYIEKGFNAEKCDLIINFLAVNFKIYYNLTNQINDDIDDDDDIIYSEYCKAIDQLQIFIYDLSKKIDDFIESFPPFLNELTSSLHKYTFQSIENYQFIYKKMEDDELFILNNRPGWHGYSLPKNIFAFCVTVNEYKKTNSILFIHSIEKKMEINTIQIPEELDNVFAQAIINSIITKKYFHLFFKIKSAKKETTYVPTNTIKGNKSFISYNLNYDDNSDIADFENKAKADLINSINLVKSINPFLPRSLLILNQNLSLVIELQSSGLSNIHSRVYDCSAPIDQNKKKKRGKNDTNADPEPEIKNQSENINEYDLNSPFYNLPYAYKITKDSLNFLWNNIDELKGFSPSIRIAWNASEFLNFGNNKNQNERIISKPKIYKNKEDKNKSVFENPSNLLILTDKKYSQLGNEIPFETFSKPPKVNIYQRISQFLPESCKVTSDSFMFIVQNPGCSIYIRTNDSRTKQIDQKRRQLIEEIFQDQPGLKIFENPEKGKLAIDFEKFLRYLDSNITDLEQLPDNISFESRGDESSLKEFSVSSIQEILNDKLNIDPEDPNLMTLGRLGSYCFLLKITKMVGDVNESDIQKENLITKAIRSTIEDLYGINPIISHSYDIYTFIFPVRKYQGLKLNERLDQISSQIIPKIHPFMFNIRPEANEQKDKCGVIKFDIFSEKVAIETAKLIKYRFEGEILTKPFKIPYLHPALKEHKQTMDKIESWIISNSDKLHREEEEWVGPISDVDKLQKQFKLDVDNKVFIFDYRPFILSIKKFKNLKAEFEKKGFIDYQYNRLYEVLVIRPEKLMKFDLDGQILNDQKINGQPKFCNHVCKGSIAFGKRLPLYDFESDSWNTIYATFCEHCLLNSIPERTIEYFTKADVMNDASKIVCKSREGEKIHLETKWHPFDLLLQKKGELNIGKNFSVPIGQFLFYLVEQSSQKLNPFLRAWVNMAADVAVRQCSMITSCPDHLAQVVKLSKSSTDVIKCGFGKSCKNYFHMKCLKWHSLPLADDPGAAKKKCKIRSIGFEHDRCPCCGVPSFNLFNNLIIFCDRCGCSWCFACKEQIDQEKVMKHLREFHDGNYNL